MTWRVCHKPYNSIIIRLPAAAAAAAAEAVLEKEEEQKIREQKW